MPAESVIKALYFKDLIKWAPKQDANYEDLVTRGICLPFGKDYVIVSSFQQATDYSQGTMPTYTWTDPAPILYVRPASVTAGYARASPKVVDFDATTLPSGIDCLISSVIYKTQKPIPYRHRLLLTLADKQGKGKRV